MTLRTNIAALPFLLLLLTACGGIQPVNNGADNTSSSSSSGSAATPFDGVLVDIDFTHQATAQTVLYDMWEVANRISPENGVSVRPGLKVNTVRMIGGILKKDGTGKRVPHLDFDLVRYDEDRKRYVYDFAPLSKRINAILDGGTEIYQIVLDQPPWVFQRDYAFIPQGQRNNKDFRENERVSIYGNSLPPDNKTEYFTFIQALMRHLVAKYGESKVLSWRFRVGSEIETPEHWYGTEQDFIEHFANTVRAVRSVLPDALIGLHTRHPDFLYKNGNVKNYKNETIQSFADGLIEYCHDNNIRYDFWGISDYPIITLEKTRDPSTKFNDMFAALVNHPKWRQGTVLDVEEFSVVSTIAGNTLTSSDTAQADTLIIAMMDRFYTQGIQQIFQWGQRVARQELWRTKAFKDMKGKTRYEATISGDGANDIGAIVANDGTTGAIDAVLYHYSKTDLEASGSKATRLTLTTDAAAGTSYYYRTRLAGKANNKFQTFMENPMASDWLKPGKGNNKYGNANAVLNDAGAAAWATYENPNPSRWSQWQTAKTLANANSSAGSIISIDSNLPVFAFEKIEIRWSPEAL